VVGVGGAVAAVGAVGVGVGGGVVVAVGDVVAVMGGGAGAVTIGGAGAVVVGVGVAVVVGVGVAVVVGMKSGEIRRVLEMIPRFLRRRLWCSRGRHRWRFAHPDHGSVTLFEPFYWCEWCPIHLTIKEYRGR